MRLFKCLVPVLVLLLVEDSSATLCWIRAILQIQKTDSIIGRICDLIYKQPDATTAPPTPKDTVKAIYIITKIEDRNNHTHEIPVNKTYIIFVYQNGTGNQMLLGNNDTLVSKADFNGGSSGVGGSGNNTGNARSNGGTFDVNEKTDAVTTAGASNASLTDGSDVSGAHQRASSGGLLSATSNAHSNAFGGSTSSSSISTANGSGNAMAQSSSSAISTDGGKSSTFSHASASVNTNV